MRGVAINVGANTSLPGFRGPIRPDGTFTYVPIPERKPTRRPVPTYADLELPIPIPESHRGTRVHLDPTFAEYPGCAAYTYGDEHVVKAAPISDLSAGEYLFFYATLTTVDEPDREWIAAEWGAYLIGHFRLAEDPCVGAHEREMTDAERRRYDTNAHLSRETVDARVLVRGDPEGSRLYRTAAPLSHAQAGGRPGELLLEHTTDSGRGPWWRRPLRIPDVAPILDAVPTPP